MAKINTISPEDVYGSGSWRPLLGENVRKIFKLHILGKNSSDDKVTGVILPSFDTRLDTEDKAFQMSVGACWQDEEDKHLPRHYRANSWFFPLMMYPFLPAGDSKEHWLSPENRKNMLGSGDIAPSDLFDAFDDLRRSVSKSKAMSQSERDFFLKTERFTDDPRIPGRTSRNASLVLMRDKDNDWHLSVLLYTNGAFSYIINQARWMRSSKDGPPRDPNYPDYLLGDFTDPKGALVWHPEKLLLDPKDNEETNVIAFTKKREVLDRNPETKKIDDETLAKRFIMQDPDNWSIPTYDEQVRHMLEFYAPEVTADMIRDACQDRCGFDIPERKKSRVISTGRETSSARGEPPRRESAVDYDVLGAVTGRRSLAPTPSSAPPVSRPTGDPERAPVSALTPAKKPANPITDSGEVYWSGIPKDKATSKKRTAQELQQLMDAGGDNLRYKVLVGEFWKPLADCGLVSLPDVEPVIPDDDDAPPIPDDDAPPIPDDTESGNAHEKVKKQLFPNGEFDAFSTEKQAEASAIIAAAVVETNGGANMTALSASLVDRFVALMS